MKDLAPPETECTEGCSGCSRCASLEAALEQAMIASRSVEEAKVAFLAGLSHELITPLNAILGAAQLLRIREESSSLSPEECEEFEQLISIIEDSGQLLSSALGDIMNFSTMSQNISLDLRPVDIRELIESCFESCAKEVVAKDLIATYTISSSVLVMIDPERMRQVLFNLMKNACKFNRHGGDVCVRAEISGTSLCISVNDSGVGMADMVAERISETNFFYQGDNSRTKRFGGMGLGLAITCKLVKVMGGSLDIESGEGGTLVTVCVPVYRHEVGAGGHNGEREGKGSLEGLDARGGNVSGSVAVAVNETEDGIGRSSSDTSERRSSWERGMGNALETRKSLPTVRNTVCLVDIDHEGLASQVWNTLELNNAIVVTKDSPDVQLAEVLVTSSKQALRNRSGALSHLPVIYLARPSGRLMTNLLPIDCTQIILPVTATDLLQAVANRRGTPQIRISSSDSRLSSRSPHAMVPKSGGSVRTSSARTSSARTSSARTSSARSSGARNSIDNSQLLPAVMHTSFYKRSTSSRGQYQSTADLLSSSGRTSKSNNNIDHGDHGDTYHPRFHHHATYSDDENYSDTRFNILVAEDNDINVKICTKILQHVGGDQTGIDVVCNGRQVLRALERNPTYDLVLMDIHMPDMDGIEATKELRRRGVTCPIVALSADSTVQDECLSAGMRSFLRKPLKVKDVKALLTTLAKTRIDTRRDDSSLEM